MATESYVAHVCGDCYQFVANGFDGMDLSEDRQQLILDGFADWDLQLCGQIRWVVACDDDDGSFSRLCCDVCPDTLGGNRFVLLGLAS